MDGSDKGQSGHMTKPMLALLAVRVASTVRRKSKRTVIVPPCRESAR